MIRTQTDIYVGLFIFVLCGIYTGFYWAALILADKRELPRNLASHTITYLLSWCVMVVSRDKVKRAVRHASQPATHVDDMLYCKEYEKS